MRLRITLLLTLASALPAQQHPLEALLDAARATAPSPELASRIETVFGKLEKRGVATVWGQDYFFAAASEEAASVSINGQPPVPLARLAGTSVWYTVVKMRTGVTHSYQFMAAGKPLYARGDVTGYNPDSYPKPGVAKGTLNEKHSIVSRIYDGMTADYWFYASPGIDSATAAPVMVWQDGQNLITGDLGRLRLFTVTENLVHQKRIPPMIHILIAPGLSADKRPMRSVEYDTVSDRYPRFLLEEVFPEVEKR